LGYTFPILWGSGQSGLLWEEYEYQDHARLGEKREEVLRRNHSSEEAEKKQGQDEEGATWAKGRGKQGRRGKQMDGETEEGLRRKHSSEEAEKEGEKELGGKEGEKEEEENESGDKECQEEVEEAGF